MVLELFLNLGCIDVFDCKEFGDLSNIRIVNIEEKHENILEKQELILEKIQTVEQTHEETLNNILTIDKKIDSLLENK